MMKYLDLDDTVRARMLAEFNDEYASANRYRLKDLTPAGHVTWPEEFREACRSGDDRSLLLALDHDEFWIPTKLGKPYPLAWRRRTCVSEFNTFYVRALAAQLLAEGDVTCVVYRADQAAQPDACTALEGLVLDLHHVYASHRRRYHPTPDPTIVTIPYQPGCHHSIRRAVS